VQPAPGFYEDSMTMDESFAGPLASTAKYLDVSSFHDHEEGEEGKFTSALGDDDHGSVAGLAEEPKSTEAKTSEIDKVTEDVAEEPDVVKGNDDDLGDFGEPVAASPPANIAPPPQDTSQAADDFGDFEEAVGESEPPSSAKSMGAAGVPAPADDFGDFEGLCLLCSSFFNRANKKRQLTIFFSACRRGTRTRGAIGVHQRDPLHSDCASRYPFYSR